MMVNNLSETLKRQAISLGLCREWTEAWGECGQQELIDKYKKGIDFCIANQYPTNDFIKANFDQALLHDNLIFVDEHISLMDAPDGVYVINGESSGTLHFGGYAAATVYLRHRSKLNVIAEGEAKVFIRLYDEAEANVCGLENAVVKVYERRVI